MICAVKIKPDYEAILIKGTEVVAQGPEQSIYFPQLSKVLVYLYTPIFCAAPK